MNPIIKLKDDIENRVKEECERLRQADNPRKEVKEYVRNISWYSPELAAYLEKQFLTVLDLGIRGITVDLSTHDTRQAVKESK